MIFENYPILQQDEKSDNRYELKVNIQEAVEANKL